MDILVTLIRILAAVLAPLSAIVLSFLAYKKARGHQGDTVPEGQVCIQCGEARDGGQGYFHYTEDIGNPRERVVKNQLTPSEEDILGSEEHFVCDQCAQRYIRNEAIQQVLIALLYPFYLFVLSPLFFDIGFFAGFLIESFLLVLAVAGAVAAIDLYRGVRRGYTPLAEARDRTAIKERKKSLGKGFSYFTRMGTTKLKK